MRSYKQTVHDALRRTEGYQTGKVRRRKAVTKTVVPILSFLLAALIGLGIWKTGMHEERRVPVIGPEDTAPRTEKGSKDSVPEICGTDERVINGTMDPDEHSGQEPGPGNVNGPFAETGDGSPAVSPTVIIDDFTNAPEACYALPGAGEFGISMPLRAAMDEYGGDDVLFRVAVDIFDGTRIISDREALQEEADRLYQLGYIAGVETVTFGYVPFETNCFFLIASREQLENFAPRPDRAYFMFLYNEYMRAAELIDY